MATISSPGIGSGLDTAAIVTQLMAIERLPKDKLAAEATKTQSQISEVGKISSAVSKLRDLASKLASSTFWQQTSASSSSTAVAVTSSSSAVPASYSVNVTKLADSQSLVAAKTFSAPTAFVGSGTLTLELGTWDASQASLTPRVPASSVNLTIEATDTLETLRDKINSAGAGVSAAILTDGSGSRLVMRSKDTGAANGFAVSVANASGDLGSLAYPPSGAKAATLNAPAADARATINGLPITSASNTLANVLDGLSLTLTTTTPSGPVTVNVASDQEALKKTLQEFATAYSEIVKAVVTNTKYDSTSRKAGPLQGDSAIVGVLSRLRTALGQTSGASAAFQRMSDIGFEQQRDGSLTVNETRLKNALSNLTELRAAFSNNNPLDSSVEGFGRRFRALADGLLNVDGTLTSRKDGLSQKLQRNQKSQEALDQRLAQTQKRLEAQYGALDTKMSASNGLSSYVSQQIVQWNRVA